MKKFLVVLGLFLSFNSFAQNCDAPTNAHETDSLVTLQYAHVILNFNAVDSAHNYKIQFRELGTATWQWRLCGLDTSKAFGFNHNTAYEWRARTTCDTVTNFFSNFSVVDTFYTGSFVAEPFSPSFDVELSHLECDSLADLTFTVSQDPNEPDISSSSIFSSAGSFAINTLSVGNVVGEANVIGGGGFYQNNYSLTVDQIVSVNEAIIAMVNDSTGVIDASFTIENDNGGIKIVNTFPADGNYYTTGNSSVVLFYNLFLNPGPGSVDFFSTIQSELGNTDNQSVNYIISCIDAIEENALLVFYPNPTDDVVYFQEQGIASLYAVSGQEILEEKVFNSLDLSSLEDGVYFLFLQTENKLYKGKLLLR